MEEQDNVVVVKFPEPSKTYQALSILKQAGGNGRVKINQAAVVERTIDGRLQVPEGGDKFEGMGLASGSLIGMLIGVLGGPVGLLLGWGAGAVIGGAYDVTRETSSDSALALLGRSIPPGSTALIAEVHEYATEVIDGEMQKLGGQVMRQPTYQVMNEVESAEDAASAAADQANRVMREKRKVERKEKREQREQELKAKYQEATENAKGNLKALDDAVKRF